MLKIFLLSLSVLSSYIMTKSTLKKFTSKKFNSKKLKFINRLTNRIKKGDVWSAVKYKRGNPDGKTGQEWCTSDQDGGVMLDCTEFWNENTLKRTPCDKKSDSDDPNQKVKCKVASDQDQKEVHDALPNEYSIDSCWKFDMFENAKIECNKADCPNSKIMRITYAQLGLSMGNCPNFYTDFQCHQDVMVSLSEKCVDQEKCEFLVSEGIIQPLKDLINLTTQEQVKQCGRIKAENNFKLTVVATCQCLKKPGATGDLKKADI